MRLVAGTIALLAAVAAATAGAQTPTWSDGPSFSSGYRGGEIGPPVHRHVAIASSGLVTVDGRVTARLSRRRLLGIAEVVRRERFFSLPRVIQCRSVHMLGGYSYASATVGGRTRTVRLYGMCGNVRFGRVAAAIARAAGAR